MQRSPGLTSEAIGNIISNLIDKWVLEIEAHIKITPFSNHSAEKCSQPVRKAKSSLHVQEPNADAVSN